MSRALRKAETTIANMERAGLAEVVSTRPSTSAGDNHWTRLTVADLRAVVAEVADLKARIARARREIKTMGAPYTLFLEDLLDLRRKTPRRAS